MDVPFLPFSRPRISEGDIEALALVLRSGRITTDWNSERICSRPLLPDMTTGQAVRVVESIKSVLATT